MANECMDIVVFYAVSEDQEKGLIKFREVVKCCYETKKYVDGGSLSRIFEETGIPVSDLSLRSTVVYSDLEGGNVTLECISAWSPPYEAYSRLANSFGIKFVLQAEEPGFSIYYNTDMDKRYLTTEYKVYLIKRPEDHSLDNLFNNAGEETDFYFDSDEELIDWFGKYADINVKTVAELRERLNEEYVCVYEFQNPYQ